VSRHCPSGQRAEVPDEHLVRLDPKEHHHWLAIPAERRPNPAIPESPICDKSSTTGRCLCVVGGMRQLSAPALTSKFTKTTRLVTVGLARNLLRRRCLPSRVMANFRCMIHQGHMNARATAISVIAAGAASMMLAGAVPAAAEPSFEPAGASSFLTAPADCTSGGDQTGSGADPTPAAQGGINAIPSPSPGECVNIGPGGPGYDGTDPRGKN
jgi:hypothetical protein